jgi:hypothetical protein
LLVTELLSQLYLRTVHPFDVDVAAADSAGQLTAGQLTAGQLTPLTYTTIIMG